MSAGGKRGHIPHFPPELRMHPNGHPTPHLRTLKKQGARKAVHGYSRGLEDDYARSRARYAGHTTHSVGAMALAGRFFESQQAEVWNGRGQEADLTEEEIEEMIANGKVVRDRVEDTGQTPIEETQAWAEYQLQLHLEELEQMYGPEGGH